MKYFKGLFIVLSIILSWANLTWSATYYMRADGTAANKGAATGPCGTVGNCMSMATHNGETFSADDIINLCDDGGNYKAILEAPSLGTSGHPITYQKATGDTPIIDASDVHSTWTTVTPSTNLIGAPENFDTGWTKVRVTINVNDTTDPAGVATADGLVATAAENSHFLIRYPAVAAVTQYTFSVYAKPGENDWVLINIIWADAGWGDLRQDARFFNVSTGALGWTVGAASWAITATANGWYRISGTTTSPALTANVSLELHSAEADEDWSFLGDGTSVYTYLAWAKWEVGALTNYRISYYSACTTNPLQTFENDVRLTPSAYQDAVHVGGFWWDDPNDRLYVRTTGDDSPAGYTITASKRAAGIILDEKNYVKLSGLKIIKAYQDGIQVWTSTGVEISNCEISWNHRLGINEWRAAGTDTLTISYNTIHHNGGSGIEPTNLSASTISHNTIYNNCILDEIVAHQYGAGIKLAGANNANNIVEYNTVYLNGTGTNGTDNQDRAGIWFDTAGAGNIARYNLVYQNLKYGIFVEDTDSNQVYYNIVHSQTESASGRGITIGRSSNNNVVYNNISYGNVNGLNCEGTFPETPNDMTGNIFKNNISVGNTSRQFSAFYGGENDGTNGSGNIYTYNCLGAESANFIQWGFGVYKSTYDAWETAYGGSTYSVEADPLFVIVGTDFHLQKTSPCINAGTDVGLRTDYDGKSVPAKGRAVRKVDIGVYEYQYRFAPD